MIQNGPEAKLAKILGLSVPSINKLVPGNPHLDRRPKFDPKLPKKYEKLIYVAEEMLGDLTLQPVLSKLAPDSRKIKVQVADDALLKDNRTEYSQQTEIIYQS